MSSLPKLFSPMNIGPMQLKNRLAMSAMTTNYGTENFEVSERLIKFHETRAAGGVGLITVEMCSVDVEQRYQPQALSLGDDRFIEGHRQLTDRVHALGAKIQPQISHPGPESMTDPIGPSVNIAAGTGWPCRIPELEELDQILDLYAAAAVRAQQAGYDGLELHAAHAYMLLGSFLSTQRNRREDDYNGSTAEGRSKLLLDCIARIKAATGPDFPITLRISGHEAAYDGRHLNDTQLLAPQLENAGVDCIQVSGGVSHDKLVAQIVCGSHYPDGYNVGVASAIKKVVDIPVMVVGRIHHPELAEQIIAGDQADIVMMARPLLADPELPNKARIGRIQDIRLCLSCENCIDSMLLDPFGANMNCAVNAQSGRETELIIAPAITKKRVVIVGGGTGGMEAARVCALRGHEVILLEQSKRLGGSLFFASTVHSDNERLLNYLLAQMKALDIDVRLNQTADLQLVNSLRADAVIVATGAGVELPDIAGRELSHVYSGSLLRNLIAGHLSAAESQSLPTLQRLAGQYLFPALQPYLKPHWLRRATRLYMPLGHNVTVVGSDLAAIELAEFLAERGRQVSILSESRHLATEVGPKRRQEHFVRLDQLKVEILSSTRVTAIRKNELAYNCQGHCGELAADSVVLAGEAVADTRLFESLADSAEQVFTVGDCTGLGLIRKAIEEAMRVACAI